MFLLAGERKPPRRVLPPFLHFRDPTRHTSLAAPRAKLSERFDLCSPTDGPRNSIVALPSDVQWCEGGRLAAVARLPTPPSTRSSRSGSSGRWAEQAMCAGVDAPCDETELAMDSPAALAGVALTNPSGASYRNCDPPLPLP